MAWRLPGCRVLNPHDRAGLPELAHRATDRTQVRVGQRCPSTERCREQLEPTPEHGRVVVVLRRKRDRDEHPERWVADVRGPVSQHRLDVAGAHSVLTPFDLTESPDERQVREPGELGAVSPRAHGRHFRDLGPDGGDERIAFVLHQAAEAVDLSTYVVRRPGALTPRLRHRDRHPSTCATAIVRHVVGDPGSTDPGDDQSSGGMRPVPRRTGPRWLAGSSGRRHRRSRARRRRVHCVPRERPGSAVRGR